jgi:glycosyltransferase involved in cell wall biosynthesis
VSKVCAVSEQLRLVVDGIIYQIQATGGISRLFSEIFPRMCRLDESMKMRIFTSGPLAQEIPKHPHIHHLRIPDIGFYLRPAILWHSMEDQIRWSWSNLWIGQGKGKIWHSTYYTMPPTWKGLQVVTVADMIYERFPDLFSGLGSDQFRESQKRCIMAADAVLCISEATSKDVQEIYQLNPDRLHVVHLAYSEIFRPIIENNDSGSGSQAARQPFFLYVGSRAHYKNFSSLISAYSRWKNKEEVRLLVVGPPWTQEEGKELASLGIEGRIDLITNAQDDLLCALYNQAAAFVYPSLYEGFGIPLLEALACGCPVIASRIATTVEIAEGCPVYFEVGREDSLIASFDKVLAEGRKSARTIAGLEHVKKFSWDKTAQGTLDIYKSLT